MTAPTALAFVDVRHKEVDDIGNFAVAALVPLNSITR